MMIPGEITKYINKTKVEQGFTVKLSIRLLTVFDTTDLPGGVKYDFGYHTGTATGYSLDQ